MARPDAHGGLCARGAAARFIVFYRDATTLVELSVFGPAEGIDARAERFFSGYSPPSSASDAS